MRRRFQKPRIKNKGGYWIAQFRDLEGRKRKVSLGPVAKTKKVDAETKLARLLEPLNNRLAEPTPDFQFGAFVRQVYLPFYRRKWKASTTACNEDRLGRHYDIFHGQGLSIYAELALSTVQSNDAETHSLYFSPTQEDSGTSSFTLTHPNRIKKFA